MRLFGWLSNTACAKLSLHFAHACFVGCTLMSASQDCFYGKWHWPLFFRYRRFLVNWEFWKSNYTWWELMRNVTLWREFQMDTDTELLSYHEKHPKKFLFLCFPLHTGVVVHFVLKLDFIQNCQVRCLNFHAKKNENSNTLFPIFLEFVAN